MRNNRPAKTQRPRTAEARWTSPAWWDANQSEILSVQNLIFPSQCHFGVFLYDQDFHGRRDCRNFPWTPSSLRSGPKGLNASWCCLATGGFIQSQDYVQGGQVALMIESVRNTTQGSGMISIDKVFVWWSYGPGRCIKVDVCIFTSSAIWDEWYIVLGWRDASNHTLNYLVTLLSEHHTEPQRPNLDCPFCCWKIARFCRVQKQPRLIFFLSLGAIFH